MTRRSWLAWALLFGAAGLLSPSSSAVAQTSGSDGEVCTEFDAAREALRRYRGAEVINVVYDGHGRRFWVRLILRSGEIRDIQIRRRC